MQTSLSRSCLENHPRRGLLNSCKSEFLDLNLFLIFSFFFFPLIRHEIRTRTALRSLVNLFTISPIPPTNAIFAVPVNGAGRLLCLSSMSPAPIQHERDPAIGLSPFTENCWFCTSLGAQNLNAALRTCPILKRKWKMGKKKVAKRTQLTLIYLISLYTRQNQGRVSCSLYSGNNVVYISHIVEPYNTTCVLWLSFMLVCWTILPSSVSL